jgi:FixJ family two-component response regulator
MVPSPQALQQSRSSFADRVSGQHPIAVVDDDSSVRRALQRLLRAMGFTVSPFCSAEEFLASGSLEDFDCLLVDVQLHGMSGVDLYKCLLAVGCGIPTIFISGTVDEATIVAKTGRHGVAFLAKPLDEDRLRAALECTVAALPS